MITGPNTTADPDGERTKYSYDAAGRLVEIVTPRGMATATVGDHTIEVGYDKLDRRISETRHDDGQAVTTQAGYNTVGDLTTVTTPKNHVTTMGYDPAHRLTEVTDPENRVTRQAYDANGNVTEVTDEAVVTTEISYDQRDRRIKTTRPHTDTRDLVTQWVHDSNVTTVIPPRAFDAAGGTAPYDQYVTHNSYNQVDELARIAHPTSTAQPQATYTRYRYGAGGQLRLVTHAQLARWGQPASLELVRALMRDIGLVACQPRPWRAGLTEPDPAAGAIGDLVRRDLTAPALGAKLVGDISYIPTWEGWLYLATVIDCHTKEVVGYAMDNNDKPPLIVAAIDMAAANTPLAADAIFHSDRGSNYTSRDFADKLRHLGLRQSVGRTGSCLTMLSPSRSSPP